MLTSIAPKLPMRNKQITRAFYLDKLGFSELGASDFPAYLMVRKDLIELHFFEFKELNPKENYGQIYIRVHGIEAFYQKLQEDGVEIHPNGPLQLKPWGQKEFSILDPDTNLITFGEGV
jgi:catechol 2,3-dioxygenase-like lactoylglutathione lyase family enzyme